MNKHRIDTWSSVSAAITDLYYHTGCCNHLIISTSTTNR